MKNNTSFTEAELKAITPWRNALIERLLANQAKNKTVQPSVKQEPSPPVHSEPAPNLNLFCDNKTNGSRMQMFHNKPQQSRQRQGRGQARGQSLVRGPPFHDVGHLAELEFGDGPGFSGRVMQGTTAFTAISGSIKQVGIQVTIQGFPKVAIESAS